MSMNRTILSVWATDWLFYAPTRARAHNLLWIRGLQ